jgi:hypothetical protein
VTVSVSTRFTVVEHPTSAAKIKPMKTLFI